MLDGRMWSVCNVGPQVCSVEQTGGELVQQDVVRDAISGSCTDAAAGCHHGDRGAALEGKKQT